MKAALTSLVLALPAACAASGELQRFEFARPAMGTRFRIVLYAGDARRAEAAAAAAFARIDELEARLSDWREESELSRLSRRSDEAAPAGPIEVSADLARVLAAAQRLARATGGAFDPTVGPMVALWRRARRQGELPDDAALARARAAVGHEKLRVDEARREVVLGARGMRLDLGGIAKGDALDQALAVVRSHGLERALLVGGGDVRAGAPPPGRSGWTVALAEPDGSEPLHSVELAHAALSTSGDHYQFVEIGGKRWSHVLDPRTGLGVTSRALASVLAPEGATADALATAACVLAADDALARIAGIEGAAARIVVERDGAFTACASERWPPMMPASPSPTGGRSR